MKENVMHLLFSSEFGGAEKVIIDMIKNNSDTSNFIYVSRNGGIKQHLTEDEINFYLLQKINYLSIKKIIKENEISVIHAHDFKASILASFFVNKCKVISHIHQSPYWFSKKNIKTMFFNYRVKNIKTILVTSDEIKQKYPYLNSKDKIQVLPNIVDTPKENKFPNKIYDFLFVGRLEKEKRPLIFIDYIDLIANYYPINKVGIVGQGSQFNQLSEKIMKSKNEIELLGFKKDPYEIMSQAKFLIITSEKEGFGLVIIESMQQGVPVVTMRIGGVTELLDNSNSVIVDNFSEINKRLIDVLNNEEEYEELCRNARVFSDKYRNNKHLKLKLKEVYENDSK